MLFPLIKNLIVILIPSFEWFHAAEIGFISGCLGRLWPAFHFNFTVINLEIFSLQGSALLDKQENVRFESHCHFADRWRGGYTIKTPSFEDRGGGEGGRVQA